MDVEVGTNTHTTTLLLQGERCGLTFNGSGMENGTDSIKLPGAQSFEGCLRLTWTQPYVENDVIDIFLALAQFDILSAVQVG